MLSLLISSTEKVFFKSLKRLLLFNAQCPGLSKLPQPNLVRWKTWLQAAFYYAEYFNQVKAFSVNRANLSCLQLNFATVLTNNVRIIH